MTPFVVVTMARSGSTHLVELLNMHPQVVCNREILCPDHDDWSPARQHWPYEVRDNNDWSPSHEVRDTVLKVYTCTDAQLIEEALLGYQVRGEKTEIAAVGCKILAEQLQDRPMTISELQHVGVRFIVLERRNQFDRLRSLAQVELTGEWGHFRGEEGHQPPRPRLDLARCQVFLGAAEEFYHDLRSLPATLWVYYEDLRDHQDQELERLWEFLGVPSPGPLTSPLMRQETRSLRDSIENFTELCQFFGCSRYEEMLK